MIGPRLSETDVRKTDGTPGEQGSKTRKGEKPVEDERAISIQVDVCKGAEGHDKDDGEERATGAINVSEDLGSISLLGKSSQCAGATIDTRHTNGHDGNQDDDVHEAVEALETGIFADEHERRSIDIDERIGTEKVFIIRADEKTNKGEADDIEEGDTPEDLSDSTGQVLEGILGLGRSKTNQLGSAEGKGGRDEDGAETLEAIAERSGVIPGASTPVFIVDARGWTTSENQDKGDNHEDDGRTEFEARGPKFFLGVAKRAEYVDQNDKEPEDGDPDGHVDAGPPVFYCETGDSQFER